MQSLGTPRSVKQRDPPQGCSGNRFKNGHAWGELPVATDREDGDTPLESHGVCREQGALGGRVHLGLEMETGGGLAVEASEAGESVGKPSWLLSGQHQSVF